MSKRGEIYSQIAYGLFYTGVVIEVLMVLIDKSEYINPIEGRLFQITFLLFAGRVLLTKYTVKEYVTIALFVVLGIISYFAAERNEILRLVIFVAACKGIDIKRCLKLVFYMTLAGCMLLILLSLTGIYGAASLTMDYGRGSEETRYVLGLGHPNALQCMVWALTVLFLFLYGEKLRWYGYLCLAAVNGFFFCLTGSRTSLLAAIFAITYAGILMLVKNHIFRQWCCAGGILITVCVIALSVVIAANAYRVYNFHWYWEWSETTEYFLKLDNLLTGRIHSLVGTERWEGTLQTWKLFSGPENNYYFDFGWIRLFYWYGIVPALIYISVMLLLMIYCAKQKEYMAFVMITAFAVYSFSEAHGISVYIARNYVFFLIGSYWYRMFHVSSGLECHWWGLPGLKRKGT